MALLLLIFLVGCCPCIYLVSRPLPALRSEVYRFLPVAKEEPTTEVSPLQPLPSVRSIIERITRRSFPPSAAHTTSPGEGSWWRRLRHRWTPSSAPASMSTYPDGRQPAWLPRLAPHPVSVIDDDREPFKVSAAAPPHPPPQWVACGRDLTALVRAVERVGTHHAPLRMQSSQSTGSTNVHR
jgi:hypothetical protein